MTSQRQQLDAIDANVARVRSQFDQVARELSRLYEVEMEHKDLAQKILRWIKRAQDNIENAQASDIHGYLTTLVEDIEKLCKRQTDKES
jgi:peptide subunit release factor RF-3